MNFATGYSFGAVEIIRRFPLKNLRMTNKSIGRRRDEFIVGIFIYAVQLMIEDIVKNGGTFCCPNNKGWVEMQEVKGEEFIKARKNGKFLDVDYYKSNYTGFQPIFIYKVGRYKMIKNVYVSKYMQEFIAENTNNGFKYTSLKEKTISDYIEQVGERFPEAPLSDIRKILTYGFNQIYSLSLLEADILIKEDRIYKFLFHIGKLTYDSLKHWHYSMEKWKGKYRLLNRFKKTKYDGYYYIGIRAKQLPEFLKEFNKDRSVLRLKNAFLYKLLDEIRLIPYFKFIIKVKERNNEGFTKYYRDTYETRDFEFIQWRVNKRYEPIDDPEQYIDKLIKHYVTDE